MTGRLIVAVLALVPMATAVLAETRYLCWQGASGYTMTGRFAYPDRLAGRALIREGDITDFAIRGFRDGKPVGAWSLDALEAGTSWRVRYDPQRHLFVLEGRDGLYQMWNANGAVDDCGTPGFGFNAGNGGQDVCVDGRFVTASTIDPATPLVSYARPQPRDCIGTPLLGKTMSK